jgi:hypothetical protein
VFRFELHMTGASAAADHDYLRGMGSPYLKVLVMTRRSDPRTGDTTYRLTNIVRAEPDPRSSRSRRDSLCGKQV